MKRVLAIVLVALLSFCFAGMTFPPGTTATEKIFAARDALLSQDTPEIDPERDIDVLMNTLENTATQISMQSGTEFEFERVDNVIIYKTWSDGMAAVVAAANNGATGAVETWENTISAMELTRDSIQNIVDSCGFSDYEVQLFLLNDVNTDNVLLVVGKDGVLSNAVE